RTARQKNAAPVGMTQKPSAVGQNVESDRLEACPWRAVCKGPFWKIDLLSATLISWSTSMPNLTITVDAAVLKKARMRALTEGSSVNAILRKFLESYAGVKAEQAAALEDLLALSRKARSRHEGRRWT